MSQAGEGNSINQKRLASVFFKGMAMGAADSVPGVSGGTIAFISGIYLELVTSIQKLNPLALKVLWLQGPGGFWRHINGTFLLTLLLGIVSSLLLLSRGILYLLLHYRPLVLAFFCGLVLASVLYMFRNIPRWQNSGAFLCLLGAVSTLGLALLPQAETDLSLVYTFVCGAVAICAMILPGISGAFILIILGAYGPVLEALRSFDFLVIGVFCAGCAFGLMAFSQLLKYLFEHFRVQTFCFLLGVLLGSLYTLWPWKQVLSTRLNSHGEEVPVLYQNLWPWHYTSLTGADSHYVLTCALLLSGFFVIIFLERIAQDQME